MILSRSFLGIASISLTAEGLIRILYLATPFHILEDLFEYQIRFTCSCFKGSQILGILCQALPDCFVDDGRERAMRLGGLEAQDPMQLGIEIDSGSFGLIFHASNLTAKRYDVKTFFLTRLESNE